MNEKEAKKQLILRSLITGLVGGIFLYFSFRFFIYFKFLEEGLFLFLKVTKNSLIQTMIYQIFVFIAFVLVSIVVASIYYVLFKKIVNLWFSMFYGIGIGLIYFGINFFLKNGHEMLSFNVTTYVTLTSLFILYGVFIGYSISFDYYETNKRIMAIQIEGKN